MRESSVVLNHVWAQSGGPVASLRELGAAIYGVIDGGRPQVRLWVGWSGREWRDGGKVYYLNVSFASLAGSGGSAGGPNHVYQHHCSVILIIIIIVTISIIIILHDYQTC